MSLSLSVAADIANGVLTMYIRGKAFAQTIQEKPLLRLLREKKKEFPGGKDYVSYPVQGVYMSDTAGFLAGYSEDDQLTFRQAANLLRAQYPWKEVHAGLIITWTELKKTGITTTDDNQTSTKSEADLVVLTNLLQNRLEDYGESYARSMNNMFWRDGSQDSKAIPGILSILTDSAAVGTTGSLNRATYTWWRHRVLLNIATSEQNQTLSKTLRSELRQLRRYGGRPDTALCGSVFLDSLQAEIQAKGTYTMEGFKKDGVNDLGMADITMRGLGTFTYDPTLDDLGLSNRCYVMDRSKLTLHPMTGEWDKNLKPTRPYDYLVWLKSVTCTGAIGARQLNCHGVYSVSVG